MVMVCIILIGTVQSMECSLRPIISINLKDSGYNLEKQVNESNQIIFNLSKK